MNKLLAILLVFGLVLSGCSGPVSSGNTYPPSPELEEQLEEKRAEVESHIGKALLLIYTDYDFNETQTSISREDYLRGVRSDMDEGLIQVTKAKSALRDYEAIAPSYEKYQDGWWSVAFALEDEAEGTRKDVQFNLLKEKGRDVDEEYLKDLVEIFSLRKRSVYSYEIVVDTYPYEAEQIDAKSRLAIVEERLNSDTTYLQEEIDAYESQHALSEDMKTLICEEAKICAEE